MLHVLLVILKVAGIVILLILLVLLLLLILVLFVPIRYRVYARKKTEVYAKSSASWLFHIVDFSFYYDGDGASQRLRIFGIPSDKIKEFINKLKSIFIFKKTENKKPKNKKSKNKITEHLSENVNSKSVTFEDEKLNDIDEKPVLERNKSEKTEQVLLNSKDNSLRNEIAQKAVSKRSKKNQKFSLIKWYRSIKIKVKSLIKKIKNAIKKIFLTCKTAKDKYCDVKSFLQDERNKEAFGVCKEQFIIVLKHIKPKKYKADVKFGTGDPALTGQILGILGMLMPVYRNNAHFVPDFENVILQGDIYMSGRITLAKVLLIAWKLYRDKKVKRCYKMIMD